MLRDVVKISWFCFPANCKVCFVALVQSFSHYNIVGQKLVSISDSAVRSLSECECCEAVENLAREGLRAPWAPGPSSEGVEQRLLVFC